VSLLNTIKGFWLDESDKPSSVRATGYVLVAVGSVALVLGKPSALEAILAGCSLIATGQIKSAWVGAAHAKAKGALAASTLVAVARPAAKAPSPAEPSTARESRLPPEKT